MNSVSKAAVLFGACEISTVACKKNIQQTVGADERVKESIRKVDPKGVMTTISSTLISTVSGSTTYQKVDCAFGNY